MINTSIDRLRYLCDYVPARLREISEVEFAARPHPDKWSKKGILGHLIDSAANNHHRFVRVQFEDTPTIWYDQDNWVRLSRYDEWPADQLISFWASYNRHLGQLVERIPEASLSRHCRMKDGSTVTLEFLITDYVVHLEHHLHQLGVHPDTN